MKKNNITEFLLEALFAAGAIIECLSYTRQDMWNAINGTDYGRSWSKKQFNNSFNNLKKSGYIKLSGSDNCSVEFTNKAKLRIIDRIASKIESDSHNRFVSFDVPEEMRRERDAFRRAIKRLGFLQIQKSLWVINKDVGGLVEMAAYELGLEKYVVYIASKKSDIDGIIEKKFKNE